VLLVFLALLANIYLLSRPAAKGGWRDLPRTTRYLMLGGSARFPFLVAVDNAPPVAGRRTSSRAGTHTAKPKRRSPTKRR
jgi:hypothetical protein